MWLATEEEAANAEKLPINQLNRAQNSQFFWPSKANRLHGSLPTYVQLLSFFWTAHKSFVYILGTKLTLSENICPKAFFVFTVKGLCWKYSMCLLQIYFLYFIFYLPSVFGRIFSEDLYSLKYWYKNANPRVSQKHTNQIVSCMFWGASRVKKR